MRRCGHFEFGLDRRPMNLGDAASVRRILAAWAQGDEVRGWACYWNMVYGYLARLLRANPQLRAAAHIVRFEDLCAFPEKTVRGVLDHCRLTDAQAISERVAGTISAPSYYKQSFSAMDLAVIGEETAAVAAEWGY